MIKHQFSMELEEDFELKQNKKAAQDDDEFDYCFEAIEKPKETVVKRKNKQTEVNYNERLQSLIRENMSKKTTKEEQSVIFEVEEDKESSVYFNVNSPIEKTSTTLTIANLIDEELGTIDKSKGNFKEEREKEKKLKELKAESARIKMKEERLKESAIGGMITNNLAMKAKMLVNTEQSLSKEKRGSDTKSEETKPVEQKAACQIEDWDKVNQERKTEQEVNEDTINSLTYQTTWNKLKSQDLTKEISLIVREDTAHMNPLKRFYNNYIRPIKLNDSLINERDVVLALMKVKVTTNFHSLMLEKIYRLISVYMPSSVNKSWVVIGFQSSSPETDIRGTGMFGVLQVHFFAENYPLLLKRYFLLSLDEKQKFPLVIVMFGFTAMTAEALREGRLTSLCNSEKSVIKAVNLFYAASIHLFMERWIKEKLTIVDRDRVFNETSKHCKDNANKLINNFLKNTK